MKRTAVTAFMLLALVTVLAWRVASIYRDSIRGKGIRLVIGGATAYRGSHGNRLEVSLENPEVRVRGIQLEICDADNQLSCAGCEITERSSGFICASHEKPNGCYELLLFSFTRVIEKGTGPLLSFSCDAADEAPGGECRGTCRDVPRCPDDGLYCNGREYCDEDARQCRRSPEPCAHCYDAGCRCDEERDRCERHGSGKGDSI